MIICIVSYSKLPFIFMSSLAHLTLKCPNLFSCYANLWSAGVGRREGRKGRERGEKLEGERCG